MTEEQIERMAERRMNGLDARLMSGALSQVEYDKLVRELDRWAQDQMDRVPAPMLDEVPDNWTDPCR